MRQTLNDLFDALRMGLSDWILIGTVLFVALSLAQSAAKAADCSIATHGESAYERVKEKIQQKMAKVEQFSFEPYRNVEISQRPGCTFVLQGRFSFKQQRNNVSKVYDAKVTPKSGAPHGMKIVNLRIGNP